jgi:hypothetical protein
MLFTQDFFIVIFKARQHDDGIYSKSERYHGRQEVEKIEDRKTNTATRKSIINKNHLQERVLVQTLSKGVTLELN